MDLRFFDDEFLEGVRKDITYEIQMVVKTVSEQISNRTSANSSTRESVNYYFSTRFYTQAQELGLTEEDASDVFTNGQEIKEGVIVREYNGYEIGIEYVQEQFSGKPVITAIWRHELSR